MKNRQPADAGFNGGRASAPSQSAIRERRLLILIAAAAAVFSFAGLSMRPASRPDSGGDTLQQAVHDVIARSRSQSSAADDPSPVDAAEGGYTAVIIAQPADCDGNLGAFGLLDRETIAARIPHRLLIVQGSAADTVGLRRRLPRSLQQAHMALLTHEQRSMLRQLGHVATPALLLFNRSRQLRYASTSPAHPVERTVQLAVITRLVTNHPDPTTP